MDVNIDKLVDTLKEHMKKAAAPQPPLFVFLSAGTDL